MLTLDLASLPDAEIKTVIAERCSGLGAVDAIAVHRPYSPDQFPFALVEMSDPVEVENVARIIGDFVFGRAALVKLVQEPAAASAEPRSWGAAK